jgi:hypothetical protein
MELGELVALSLGGTNDPCTFCDQEKPEKKQETLDLSEDTAEDSSDADEADDQECTLHNDSGKLADALGSQPFALITHPPGMWFWKGYRDKHQSRVCGNAHHLIPGNASFAKCKAILKWMAKTVKIKKVTYTSREIDEGVFPQDSDEPGVTVTKTVSKTKTGKKEVSVIEAQGQVYGKIDYDLNVASNGVWLPSNNAVYRWKKRVPEATKARYTTLAMSATTPVRQFHDSHPAYSDAVLKQLGHIEMVVKKKAAICIDGSHGSADENGDLPAPQRLAPVINRLASVLRIKLVDKPGRWAAPYFTSEYALSSKPKETP